MWVGSGLVNTGFSPSGFTSPRFILRSVSGERSVWISRGSQRTPYSGVDVMTPVPARHSLSMFSDNRLQCEMHCARVGYGCSIDQM